MLIFRETEQSVPPLAGVNYGIFIEHLRVEDCVPRHQTHEVPKVLVCDIDHWGDCEVLSSYGGVVGDFE